MNAGGLDRVVVVTGASGGVGRGIALACAKRGCTVWIAARRETEGCAVAKEVDSLGGAGRFVRCDSSSEESVTAMLTHVVKRDGRLDAIVHNATSGESPKPAPLTALRLTALQDQLAVSLRGSFLLAKAGYAALRASRGTYILLTSEAGFEGKRLLPAYAATKAAQRGFARALAREWGPDGITVNSLAPLAMTPSMERAFGAEPAMKTRVVSRIPMGRIGSAEHDVGPAVAALLDPQLGYVTGNTLMADGGSCPIT
jgi:3-oxoacyl-[acyl-carrier protein] reductase